MFIFLLITVFRLQRLRRTCSLENNIVQSEQATSV